MRRLVLVALVACADPLPTCADLGCRAAASGTPVDWSPCRTGECWCSVPSGYAPPEWLQCSRTPCSESGPMCSVGEHAEHGAFCVSTPCTDDMKECHAVCDSVCFCMPD